MTDAAADAEADADAIDAGTADAAGADIARDLGSDPGSQIGVDDGADGGDGGDSSGAAGGGTGGGSVRAWVGRLAQPVGDPGGGAASGVMLAMACALTSMVAGYARDAHPLAASSVGGRADARRERALQLADVDARRSKEFGAAYHEPRGEARDAAVRSAGGAAARTSADLGELALGALDDLEAVAPLAPAFLRPDVAVAAAALRAALNGARINLAADLAELSRHGAAGAGGGGAERVNGAAPADGANTGSPSAVPDALTADLARFDAALRRLDAFDIARPAAPPTDE